MDRTVAFIGFFHVLVCFESRVASSVDEALIYLNLRLVLVPPGDLHRVVSCTRRTGRCSQTGARSTGVIHNRTGQLLQANGKFNTRALTSVEAACVSEQVHWCHKYVMFELIWKRKMSPPPAGLPQPRHHDSDKPLSLAAQCVWLKNTGTCSSWRPQWAP